MIYLYGLLDPAAPDPSPALSALDGVTGEVRGLTLPQGHLIYGPKTEAVDIPAKRRNLLAHTRVLEAALDLGTVLPMRFGMAADGLDSVAALVSAQSDVIVAEMERLAGQVEYGLRVGFDEPASLQHQLSRHPKLAAEHGSLAAAKRAGHMAYAEFGRRLGEAMDRHRTDAQHRLVQALRTHLGDLILRPPEAPSQVLSAFVMLPASVQDDLPDLVNRLARDLDFGGDSEPDISLVGPAPLYNFVRLTLAPAERAAA